jgi:hypothetical protein
MNPQISVVAAAHVYSCGLSWEWKFLEVEMNDEKMMACP